MLTHQSAGTDSFRLPNRPFHTTTHLFLPKQPDRHRRPRTFTLTPPQPPSTKPFPTSSSSPATTSSTPPSPPPTTTTLTEHFLTAMRLLTHPATVCTATDPRTTPPTPRAMTMSSLTSLTLAPPGAPPVVTFNIAVPSRTFDALAASGRFNVHVLRGDAAGARVADWLARGSEGGREVFERLVAAGGDGGGGGGGCPGGVEVDFGEGDGGQAGEPPVLKGDGVLCVLRCRLLRGDGAAGEGWVRVRDHVIVLGEVLEVVGGVSKDGSETGERFALAYADRRYRQLGNCITPVEKEEEETVIDE
ncbi:uncharacterized protein THITE_2108135 [Thermothielavioides terrestris NRRL 8126]|uniref:Flavin reductase like domain-containing protein n=1 Tax=Thermothielavioides terrestris (strain ATCC 38088 / NRRL 8126) TaxID=578455 RepID=G2QXU3_THETT|nr:uncharacterized protein THITE_2108135 [Thermothielavioides terrestris NRRL 8126]AEO63211.1 hypothetical protein THITE_2108135 [Thermothielavioides terrestris NRRL 8126]